MNSHSDDQQPPGNRVNEAQTGDNPYAAPESDVRARPDLKPLSDDIPLAGRFMRFLGAIVDFIVSILIGLPYILLTDYWERVGLGEDTLMDSIVLTGVWLLGFLIIQGYFLATRGQSIGKIVTGTRIVSVENGSILPFWRLIMLRYAPMVVLSFIPLLNLVAGLVDPLFIFRQDRRCIHDLIAGTRVVEDYAPYRTADGTQVTP